MRRLVDRFSEEAASCGTIDELHSLLSSAADELGFRYFALLHHASLARPKAGFVRIDNYPTSWADELLDGGLSVDDPIHLASRRTSIGFSWAGLGDLICLNGRHRAILSRSQHFGIGAGFTIPANVPGEPAGSCSFAVHTGAELPRRRLMCAELIGARAFAAARRIHESPVRRTRPHLSPRQVDCLRLVAMGKTDWEISVILGISAETARQYIKSARSAYGVATRSQLVVAALRDDWLRFEEAFASTDVAISRG